MESRPTTFFGFGFGAEGAEHANMALKALTIVDEEFEALCQDFPYLMERLVGWSDK